MELLKIQGRYIDGANNWCLDDIDKLWRYKETIYLNKSEISTIREILEEDLYNRDKIYHAYTITMKTEQIF